MYSFRKYLPFYKRNLKVAFPVMVTQAGQVVVQLADNNTPVTFQAGSSRNDVHVVYSIIAGDKVIESGRKDISNALINRTFKYKEAYGNGLLLTYAWVKDGKMMSASKTIQRPLPDNHLKMKWTTFRDRHRAAAHSVRAGVHPPTFLPRGISPRAASPSARH